MSYEDGAEISNFKLFEIEYKATYAQHRRIEHMLNQHPTTLEWITLNSVIRNGRGYALDPDYQALCRKLSVLQVEMGDLAIKFIEKVLNE